MNAYDCTGCEYDTNEGWCAWWELPIDEVDECDEVKIDG